MEKTLRRKFVCISVGVVFFVVFLIAAVINVTNYLEIDDKAKEIVEILVENDGRFPQVFEKPTQHLTAETPYTTRYFTIKLDENGEIINTDTKSIILVSEEQAIVYAENILETGKETGYINRYKFQVVDMDYGTLMLFIDCNQELTMFYSFLQSSILIGLVTLLCVFLLMVVLSKKAVAPIVDSYYKQQQFITNITHELKTPLTIIKTNTEVMEMEHESSKWSESIHHQIARLNELINYLVSLSKLEEAEKENLKVDFSISDAMTEVASSFEVLAESKKHKINIDVLENITYCGDEQLIRMLISILIDNALKYSKQESNIELSMKKYKDKIKIEIINEAENLKIGKYDILFERFYRMEGSRNSKLGGFGIGLSIAKSIVKKHGGTIKAESKDGLHMKFNIDL